MCLRCITKSPGQIARSPHQHVTAMTVETDALPAWCPSRRVLYCSVGHSLYRNKMSDCGTIDAGHFVQNTKRQIGSWRGAWWCTVAHPYLTVMYSTVQYSSAYYSSVRLACLRGMLIAGCCGILAWSHSIQDHPVPNACAPRPALGRVRWIHDVLIYTVQRHTETWQGLRPGFLSTPILSA